MTSAAYKLYVIPPEIRSVTGDVFDLYAKMRDSGPWDLPTALALSTAFISDLLTRTSRFDPKTNQPEFQAAGVTYAAIRDGLGGGWAPPQMDGLMRQVNFVGPALAHILRSPGRGVFRCHESLPFGKAKKLDARCVVWLSRQPGRTPPEKAAAARRIKCVKRYFSPNLHENRVTARVIKELKGALKTRRLHAAGGRLPPPEHPGDAEYFSLDRWIGAVPPEDPFESVRPATRVTPNNRLLHDPHYSKVWRVWQWWRRRQEFLEKGWPLSWPAVIQVLVHATLAAFGNLPGCDVAENLLRPRLPEFENGAGEGAPYGYEGFVRKRETHFGERGPEPLQTTPAQGAEAVAMAIVDRAQGVEIYRFCPRAECREVVVAGASVRPGKESPSVDNRHWHISLAMAHSNLREGRGLPLRARITCDGQRKTRRIRFFMDRPGVEVFSKQLAEILAGETSRAAPPLAVIPRRQGHDFTPCTKRLALDLCGPDIQAAFGDAVRQVGGVMTAARLELPDKGGTIKWLAGDEAARFYPDAPGVEHFFAHRIESSLFGINLKNSKDEEALRNMLAGVARAFPKSSSEAAKAIAVCDVLDPVGCAALRRCLPPAWSTAWFVWRSVAAAMHWRETEAFGAGGFKAGDRLLVVDGDSPLPSFTLLTARSESSGPDPWFWERQPPRAIDPGANLWTFNGILENVLAETLREKLKQGSTASLSIPTDEELGATAAGLVGRGLMSSASRGAGPEVILASSPEGFREPGRFVTLDAREAMLRASERFLAALEHHLKGWLKKSTLGRLFPGGTAGLHVLLSGSPFEGKQPADRFRAPVKELLPGATVHVIENAREAACRGAMTFLLRRAEGKPTWRDLLPSLHLKVEGAPEPVELLPKSLSEHGVHPGQEVVHPVAKTFRLPKGCDRYEFPLLAEYGEDTGSGAIALLEDPRFPLREDLEVNLETRFHYAEDAYRVFISPAHPKKAPFSRLEIRWDRASPGSGSTIMGRVRNEPPSFPRRTRWSEVWPPETDALERFVQVIEACADSLRPLCGAVAQQLAARAHKNDTAATNELLGKLNCAHEKLKRLEEEVKAAWAQGLDTAGGVGAEDAIGKMKDWLMVAAQMSPSSGGVGRLHKSLRKHPKPGIAKAVADLQHLARSALSRLREHAPAELPALIEKELPGLRGPGLQRAVQAFGRSFGFAEGDRRERYLGGLLDGLAEMGERNDLQGSRHYLWALATAFWYAEGLVPSMGPPLARRCHDVCRSLFERLQGEWKSQPIAVSLFEEACMILFGLLRLRGRPGGEAFEAGSIAMRELSDLVKEIGRSLRDQGRPPHGRLRFHGVPPAAPASGLSQLATELAENLCGYRASMIEALEDC